MERSTSKSLIVEGRKYVRFDYRVLASDLESDIGLIKESLSFDLQKGFEELYVDGLRKVLAKMNVPVASLDRKGIREILYWLFHDKKDAFNFVKYGSSSSNWPELEPIVGVLGGLLSMNALRTELGRLDAERIMRGKVDLSFLLRMSSSYRRAFVVSSVGRGGAFIRHTLLPVTKHGLYVVGGTKKISAVTFFPFADEDNKKNAEFIVIDVAKWAVGGDEAWETKLVSPVTKEEVPEGVYSGWLQSAGKYRIRRGGGLEEEDKEEEEEEGRRGPIF